MLLNKPVIGILPTYNLTNEENDPYQDRASFVTMYMDKILKCGGIPLGILDKDVSEYFALCDGYVWPGGNKIWKEFYPILDDAIKNHKPVLGVCMGMQAITTFFNILEDRQVHPDLSFLDTCQKYKEINPYLIRLNDEPLHSHFVTKDAESIDNARHVIQIEKGSILSEILHTTSQKVVSLHGIAVNRVPKSLKVSAICSDGVIEAVEYKDFILGVQFHPEIETDDKIFKWLIQMAASHK